MQGYRKKSPPENCSQQGLWVVFRNRVRLVPSHSITAESKTIYWPAASFLQSVPRCVFRGSRSAACAPSAGQKIETVALRQLLSAVQRRVYRHGRPGPPSADVSGRRSIYFGRSRRGSVPSWGEESGGIAPTCDAFITGTNGASLKRVPCVSPPLSCSVPPPTPRRGGLRLIKTTPCVELPCSGEEPALCFFYGWRDFPLRRLVSPRPVSRCPPPLARLPAG